MLLLRYHEFGVTPPPPPPPAPVVGHVRCTLTLDPFIPNTTFADLLPDPTTIPSSTTYPSTDVTTGFQINLIPL